MDALTELSSDRYAANISKACQDSLLALADCASDNDAFAGGSTTSLSTSDGCCLKSCADSIGLVRGAAAARSCPPLRRPSQLPPVRPRTPNNNT